MNKNIQLVVVDLDGTLLSEDKQIHQAAVNCINSLKEKDILFTFITGRPPQAITNYAKQVLITAPVISCNGGIIFNQKNGDVFFEYSFVISPLVDLLRSAVKLNLTVLVLKGSIEYALSKTSWTRIRTDKGRKIPIIDVDSLEACDDIYKVNIIAENNSESFKSLIPLIESFSEMYSIIPYGNQGCEIVSRGISKQTGLQKLCEICDIKIENVLAIGDNENDREMIKAAGIGAAVNNAVGTLKEVADYICERTFTDGVVEAIMKFVSI